MGQRYSAVQISSKDKLDQPNYWPVLVKLGMVVGHTVSCVSMTHRLYSRLIYEGQMKLRAALRSPSSYEG